jgi:hypothetical protein
MVLPCGWWRRGWRRAGGARMVGSAGEAIPGTMPFHRWSGVLGEGENGRAAAEASLNCVLPSIESRGGRQRATQHAGVVYGGWGEDRGINGAWTRGCRRQKHGARGVNVYTTDLYSIYIYIFP